MSLCRTLARSRCDTAQPLRYLEQQGVADVVAEGVVDVLETVQVQEHHRQRRALAVAPRRRQCLFEASLQVQSVGQVGQGVEMGEMADLLFAAALRSEMSTKLPM